MKLEIFALAGVPEVAPGSDIARIVIDCAGTEPGLRDGDIVVVAQKIVSKSEGRARALGDIAPSERATELAIASEKDPRLVQAILDESDEILRAVPGVLITQTHHGFVCANAGIDASNVPGDDVVMLLPLDADASARQLRAAIKERAGVRVAVVVTDSFGRAWRHGQQDIAIGCAGIDATADQRGALDRDGRELTASITSIADELASAADLIRTKASGEPIAVVRGRNDLVTGPDGAGITPSLRQKSLDLFR